MWDVDSWRRDHANSSATLATHFGIAITDDSATLLTTSSDTTVRMWDIASGEELNRFEQHGDWIQEIVLGPGESFGVSAGQDYVLRRWRMSSGRRTT